MRLLVAVLRIEILSLGWEERGSASSILMDGNVIVFSCNFDILSLFTLMRHIFNYPNICLLFLLALHKYNQTSCPSIAFLDRTAVATSQVESCANISSSSNETKEPLCGSFCAAFHKSSKETSSAYQRRAT